MTESLPEAIEPFFANQDLGKFKAKITRKDFWTN